MRLTFTKGPRKHDTMSVERDGAPAEVIECPKQGILPHDMVHWVVERTLGERGFLSRVVDGEAAAFRMAPDAQSDAVERLVEVVQGDQWSGGTTPAAEMLDLYRVTCHARACPMLDVDEAAIEAVRAEFARLTAEWGAVPVGGSLSLTL